MQVEIIYIINKCHVHVSCYFALETADQFVTIDLLFQNVSVVRRKGKENEGCGATIYRLRYDIYATHR